MGFGGGNEGLILCTEGQVALVIHGVLKSHVQMRDLFVGQGFRKCLQINPVRHISHHPAALTGDSAHNSGQQEGGKTADHACSPFQSSHDGQPRSGACSRKTGHPVLLLCVDRVGTFDLFDFWFLDFGDFRLFGPGDFWSL